MYSSLHKKKLVPRFSNRNRRCDKKYFSVMILRSTLTCNTLRPLYFKIAGHNLLWAKPVFFFCRSVAFLLYFGCLNRALSFRFSDLYGSKNIQHSMPILLMRTHSGVSHTHQNGIYKSLLLHQKLNAPLSSRSAPNPYISYYYLYCWL